MKKLALILAVCGGPVWADSATECTWFEDNTEGKRLCDCYQLRESDIERLQCYDSHVQREVLLRLQARVLIERVLRLEGGAEVIKQKARELE